MPNNVLFAAISLQNMEQIRRIARPTDVPDQGLLCDLLWSDPDKDVQVCCELKGALIDASPYVRILQTGSYQSRI